MDRGLNRSENEEIVYGVKEVKNIVCLVEAEIPSNTGNIARTCVTTDTALHLVRPLGFQLTDKYLKRAGMDYWQDLDLTIWDTFDLFIDFLEEEAKKGCEIIYATTKGKKTLADVQVTKPSLLIFGKESAGLPEDFLFKHIERCYRIPMAKGKRSLNLANSVAIMLYEVLRQQGFPHLY